uniref:Uncharacterized protein n=1 Tax=uncultured Alphaproteobacteria bacterium TaxID=91750 RepID=A0A6G8F395_9PROT|nr:hypothetical protein PlAlph_5540 [uncultured Alphaproteobacteria bacterium]
MTKILIHFHLYYIDQLDYFLDKISNVQGCNYDLYVTMVEKNEKAEEKIHLRFPQAHILLVPNQGYDVGPFIDVLNRVNLNDYDYVLKIHTKNTTLNNGDKINGRWISRKCWMPLLVESLIGSKKIFIQNLHQFEKRPNIGMLASKHLITSSTDSYKNIKELVYNTIKRLGFNIPQKLTFVAGTMFMARAHLFLPIIKAGYTLNDFEATGKTSQGNQLAHAFERAFGVMVSEQYNTICGNSYKCFTTKLQYWLYQFRYFLFYRKHCYDGSIIIKICKIQFYKSRVNYDNIS